MRPELIGKQRVWGTIGFGLTAFFSSRIYGLIRKEYAYIIIFIILAFLTIFITSFISIKSNDDKIKKNPPKFHLLKLLPLLKDFDVLVYLTITLFWGMCHGCMYPVS